MKRYHFILPFLALYAILIAQTAPDLVYFLEDNQSKISCANCNEPIKIKVHNKKTGGKLVYNSIVNNVPGASANLDMEKPAFALVNDSKKHILLDSASFNINLLSYSMDNQFLRVLLTNLSDVSFKLVRSLNGLVYEEVKEIVDSQLEVLKLPPSAKDYYYRIEVISKSEGLRYATKPILVRGTINATVYPTVVKENLNIELLETLENHSISILDQYGKVQKALDSNHRKLISVSMFELRAGLYFVQISNGSVRKIFKIIHL